MCSYNKINKQKNEFTTTLCHANLQIKVSKVVLCCSTKFLHQSISEKFSRHISMLFHNHSMFLSSSSTHRFSVMFESDNCEEYSEASACVSSNGSWWILRCAWHGLGLAVSLSLTDSMTFGSRICWCSTLWNRYSLSLCNVSCATGCQTTPKQNIKGKGALKQCNLSCLPELASRLSLIWVQSNNHKLIVKQKTWGCDYPAAQWSCPVLNGKLEVTVYSDKDMSDLDNSVLWN